MSRYRRVSFAWQEQRSEDGWLDLVETDLRRAVRERLVADVPVGLFLSESSLLAALMAREGGRTVTRLMARLPALCAPQLEIWFEVVITRTLAPGELLDDTRLLAT